MSATATKPHPKKKKNRVKSLIATQNKKLQDAFDEMVPDLRTKAEAILKKISELDSADIQKRYDIGTELNDIITNKSGKYGTDPKTAIGAVLRLSKDSVDSMTRVADTFTQEDLDHLTTLANPVTRERLRWNHIVTLARVPDKSRAFQYAQNAVERGWSTKDLTKAVIKASGGPRSGGGRPSKRHATIEGTVTDIETKSRLAANAAETVWLAPGGLTDQYEKLATTPGWRANDELVAHLAAAQRELERLSIHAATTLATIGTLVSRAKASQIAKRIVA